MVLYLIKVNNLYYGKKNSINGRIINPSYYTDKNILALTVKEIGYKTKTAARKAAEKIKKQEPDANINIQGLIFKE